MANGRNERTRKNPVTVSGPWFAMPIEFLRSRAWAELSPHAAKMLLDLCAGLGPNAKGNGDLSAAPAIMRPKGWVSTANRVAALSELEAAGLVATMRRGNRRLCALYAVTLWPLQCDLSKLDFGPAAFSTSDWLKLSTDRAASPTYEAPARWTALRKIKSGLPPTGKHKPNMYPLRDKPWPADGDFVPATGTYRPLSSVGVLPPRDTFLDSPSVGAVQGVDAQAGHGASVLLPVTKLGALGVAERAAGPLGSAVSPSLMAASKRTASGFVS